MAILLREDGTHDDVPLTNPNHRKLEFLQGLVGGMIEFVNGGNGSFFLVNEEGKLNGMELNAAATVLYVLKTGNDDVLCGPVLLISASEMRLLDSDGDN